MEELPHREKWWAKMIEIHGSPEAVSAFMSKSNKKGKKKGQGYFYQLKKQGRDDEIKRLAKTGLENRHAKEQSTQDTA